MSAHGYVKETNATIRPLESARCVECRAPLDLGKVRAVRGRRQGERAAGSFEAAHVHTFRLVVYELDEHVTAHRRACVSRDALALRFSL